MTLWSRKKEELPTSLPPVSNEALLTSIDQINANLLLMSRNIQELTKAMDKSTKELMRRR